MLQNFVKIRCDGGDLGPGGQWPRDYRGCAVGFSHDGVQDAPSTRKAAKAAGWTVKNGREYCPAHKGLV